MNLGPIGFEKDVRKIGNYHTDLLDQPYDGIQPSNLYNVLPNDKVFTFDYGFIVGVEGVVNFSEIGRRVKSLFE